MKKILLSVSIVLLAIAANAQVVGQYTGRRILAMDSFFLRNAWLTGVNNSTALTSTSPTKEVTTVSAVKGYVAQQLIVSGAAYNFNSLSTPSNGTAMVQVPIEDGSVGSLEAEVHGISAGGYGLVGKKKVRYEKSGGTISIMGVTETLEPTAKKLLNNADFDFEINSSTQGFQIVVTGETGIPITWKVIWKKLPTTL